MPGGVKRVPAGPTVHIWPPSADLANQFCLQSSPPAPSSISAITTCPSLAVVICTLRKKPVVTCAGAVHETPPSSECAATTAPPWLKSFQLTYIRPKNGLDALLSTAADS